MEIDIPNEVALSPSGTDLWFDTDFCEFFEPLDFHGSRRWVGSLELAKLKRLTPAMRYVKDNWPEPERDSNYG